MTAATLKRADLQDSSWTECRECGVTVVLALPIGGARWQVLEPIPDGGGPGEVGFTKHRCSPITEADVSY